MSNDYQAARIVGALPPPAGVTPNFVDPPSQDAVIIAVHTVFLTLSTLFVSMRVLLRAYVLRSFGWDDAFCILGWAFSVAFTGLTLKAMTLGQGRHLWDVPASQAVEFGKWVFIATIETSAAWAFIKLAFFWSYLRIFGPSKTMRWLCYGGAFVNCALYIAEIFHDIFICTPVEKDWNPKVPGHCLPSGVGGSVTGIFNVISDLYILILPLPFLWSLQMKTYKKVRLMVLFGIGVFVNACSITRLAITYQVANNPDVSWKVYWISIWVTLELYVGLICVSALTLPSFYNQVLLSTWHSLRSKSSRFFSTRRSQRSSTSDPERAMKLVHDRTPSSSDSREAPTPQIGDSFLAPRTELRASKMEPWGAPQGGLNGKATV